MSGLLREFGKDPKNRKLMAMAARRAVDRGDDSVYHNAYQSLAKSGVSKAEMKDFSNEFEYGGINSQPTNNLTGENKVIKNQIKLTESQLYQIIKDAVVSILNESGDTHRFGAGKYGLAMDAANKARSLGRYDQADNLTKYGADAFNKEYGVDGFEMNDYGQLYNRDKMYRPQSVIDRMEKNKGLQNGEDSLRKARMNNAIIKDKAYTAKAYPRKRMTKGLDAIDTVDKGIHGSI